MSYTNLPLQGRGRSISDKNMFPDEIYVERDKAVKKMAGELGLAGIIFYGGTLSRGVVSYLNGARNANSFMTTMWIVPKEAKTVVLTTIDARATRNAPERFYSTVPIGLNLMANDHIGVQTGKYLKDNDLLTGKWGIVNGASIPYTAYQALLAVEGVDLVDVSASYEELKSIKSSGQLYGLSYSSSFAQRAVFDFIRLAQPGTVPIELIADLERGMRMNGIEHASFLISRGKKTAFTVAEETPLKEGELVSLFADIQYYNCHGAYASSTVIGGANDAQKNLIGKAKSLLDETVSEIESKMSAHIGYRSVDESGSYIIVNSIGADLVDAPAWDGKIVELKPRIALNITANICDPNIGSTVESRTAVVSKNGLNILNDFGPQQLSGQYS